MLLHWLNIEISPFTITGTTKATMVSRRCAVQDHSSTTSASQLLDSLDKRGEEEDDDDDASHSASQPASKHCWQKKSI